MPKPPEADVPCGTCTICCHHEAVYLLPEESAMFLKTTRVHHPLSGQIVDMVDHKADGSCIHLGANGCEVYAHRPAVCRTFDCRRMVNSRLIPLLEKSDHGRQILARGRELSETLT